MKTIFVVLWLIGIVWLAGCSSNAPTISNSTPDEAMQSFASGMQNGEWKTLADKLVDETFYNKEETGYGYPHTEQLKGKLSVGGAPVTRVDVISKEGGQDSAKFCTDVVIYGSETRRTEFTFTSKVAGQWLLTAVEPWSKCAK